MMQDEIVDILLRAGIPASTKGFTYIHDALELMDRDSYYFPEKSVHCTQRLPNRMARILRK